MVRGPIDFIVLGFESSDFDGSVLKELEASVENGTIEVLDLAVVSKDPNGVVTNLEISDLGQEDMSLFVEKYRSLENALDEDDHTEVGSIIENGTTAAILVIEHVWARGLKKAILDKKGFLIADGRIHPEAAAELEGE